MSTFAVPVDLYMSAPVGTISPNDDLTLAHRRMTELGVSSLAVVLDDELKGVISRTDLLAIGRVQAGRRAKAAALTLPNRSVASQMSTTVVTVTREDSVVDAAALMVNKRIHRVIVVEGNKPVGVLSTRDVMIAIWEKQVRKPLDEFMSSPVFTIRAEEPLALATQRLENAHVSGLVVVENRLPVGVFTQVEALASRDMSRDTPVEAVMNLSVLSLPPGTFMHRAAAQAATMDVRRVVVMNPDKIVGILTGLDFARLAAA